MRTVVYQSYRTFDVPDWISRCMGTVKNWAALKGFDYEFIDDRLFEYVPDWFLKIVGRNMQLVSDLALLELAKEFLAKGYDRTIWVDADLVVFDPANFIIDVNDQFAFCREMWINKGEDDSEITATTKVHNAVTVFLKNNDILEHYINSCKKIVKDKGSLISSLDLSTDFLTEIYLKNNELSLITNVGLFSPIVMYSIVTGEGNYVERYINEFGHPIQAANLCSSFRNKKTYSGVFMDDNLYWQVIDKLIATRGDIINSKLQLNGVVY